MGNEECEIDGWSMKNILSSSFTIILLPFMSRTLVGRQVLTFWKSHETRNIFMNIIQLKVRQLRILMSEMEKDAKFHNCLYLTRVEQDKRKQYVLTNSLI